MTTQHPPDLDERALEYRARLEGPPTPRHLAELRRLGIEPPRTQREASDLLTACIRAAALRGHDDHD